LSATTDGPAVLEALDGRFLATLDEALRASARSAGAWLACRPGCTKCCIGPFPVTRLDAWRLRRALGDLARRDAAGAASLLRRARESAALLASGFPGDIATGELSDDIEAEDRFFKRHESVPCPVLDPDSGLCVLYEARPVSCRTFGPPVRSGSVDLAPCDLCFGGATGDEIERCRVEPDPAGVEASLISILTGEGGDARETLIACALRDATIP
jgi:Fe-S-cluster containining protein